MNNTNESDGEPFSTDSFFVLCKRSGLTINDMEEMTIGMCLDYINEYIELINPQKKPKERKANQADFDRF